MLSEIRLLCFLRISNEGAQVCSNTIQNRRLQHHKKAA